MPICSPYLQRLTEDPPLKVGSRESRALNSYSNRYGYINLIDPYAGDIFNPSVLMVGVLSSLWLVQNELNALVRVIASAARYRGCGKAYFVCGTRQGDL